MTEWLGNSLLMPFGKPCCSFTAALSKARANLPSSPPSPRSQQPKPKNKRPQTRNSPPSRLPPIASIFPGPPCHSRRPDPFQHPTSPLHPNLGALPSRSNKPPPSRPLPARRSSHQPHRCTRATPRHCSTCRFEFWVSSADSTSSWNPIGAWSSWTSTRLTSEFCSSRCSHASKRAALLPKGCSFLKRLNFPCATPSSCAVSSQL